MVERGPLPDNVLCAGILKGDQRNVVVNEKLTSHLDLVMFRCLMGEPMRHYSVPWIPSPEDLAEGNE